MTGDPYRPAAASVHEAQGRVGALPPAVKPLRPGMRVWGPAFPVSLTYGSNLLLHWAVAVAAPGDVLVVDAGGAPYGHWGEVLSAAATQRGLGGLVLNGGVRDSEVLRHGELPVFATGVSMVGTTKEQGADASLGTAVTLGEVTVRPGDLVVGDADGVVVVAAQEVPTVVERAGERERVEADYLRRIAAGESTIDLYGLPQPPAAVVPGQPPAAPSRRSIDVDGLAHGNNPIPNAAVVRGLVFSGGVSGVDRASGSLSDDVGEQVRLMFDNMAAILDAAGGTVADIAKLDVTLPTPDLRAVLNAEWVARFPDPAARPARKTEFGPLPAGMRVQGQFVAVLPGHRLSR